MKNETSSKRTPVRMAAAMAFALLLCGCSSDNSGGQGGDPAGNMAAVIEKLEKERDLSQFTEALKEVQNQVKEADITVIAVKNIAFEDHNADIASSDIVRHVVKGSWPLARLREATQVESVDGTKLAVEYYSNEQMQVLYVNDMVVDLDPSSMGNSIIYTTDAFVPATTALPSPSHSDYLKALGRKIEGRWAITGHVTYNIYMADANTTEVTESFSGMHQGWVEIFEWNPKSMNTVSGYFGDYHLHHRGGVRSVAGLRIRYGGIPPVGIL
ncbi:MAG: hypothetical protein LUE10_09640 [Alistipes sp.]|nr:hypothetical protein [Alistipes sp.]